MLEERTKAKKQFQRYFKKCQDHLQMLLSYDISQKTKTGLQKTLTDAQIWLRSNPIANKTEVLDFLYEFKSKCDPLILQGTQLAEDEYIKGIKNVYATLPKDVHPDLLKNW